VKIRIAGAVLTGIFFVVVAFLLSNLDVGIPSIVVESGTLLNSRLVSIFGEGLRTIYSALSEMLWHYRGIDLLIQGVFLFVAALATSVLFHEPTPKGEAE